MNSLPLHNIAPKNPELLQQIYGAVNGVFLVAAVLVLLTGISHYRASSFFRLQKGISASVAYFLVFVGFAAFGLYNIFYQSFTRAVTIETLPDWLFYISRFSSPVALASITFIFLLATEVKSYTAYRFQIKNRIFINSLYFMDLVVFIALMFIDNMNVIALITGSLFVPHCIGAVIYCMVGLKDTPYSRVMAFMFGLMSIVFTEFNRLLFIGKLNFSPETIAFAHVVFTSTHTLFTFITLRFGYEEMLRFLSIRGKDQRYLIHGFGSALKNNEFFLTYQPQVDLKTNRIYGVETLIRWQHPEHGLISPITFIELAEESGKIDDICFWVVKNSIKELHSLREELGYDINLSVNFSAKNLNRAMLEHLKSQLAYYNIPPHLITVEITETVMVDDNEETRAFLTGIEAMGIELSVDDYGTGFSSLSYLNQLQISELKIDRSFVQNITEKHEDFIISYSTIAMSKSLNYKVVAEGVESAEAMEVLRKIDCDYVQGFHIAKPMPIQELSEWIKNSSHHLTVLA